MLKFSADTAAYFINQFNRESGGKQPQFGHKSLKKLLDMQLLRGADFNTVHANMKASILNAKSKDDENPLEKEVAEKAYSRR